MMAAAGDEQQSTASRESVPAPNGETFSHDGDQAAELLRPTEHAQDAAEERLVLGLRIDDGVGFDEMTPLGLTPDLPKVRDLVEAGLLVDDRNRLRATRAGRLVLDRLTGTLAT